VALTKGFDLAFLVGAGFAVAEPHRSRTRNCTQKARPHRGRAFSTDCRENRHGQSCPQLTTSRWDTSGRPGT
jgi:hypothetical protein